MNYEEIDWNKEQVDCYARFWGYPLNPLQLGKWIDDAYSARTARNHLIKNSQDMMKHNAKSVSEKSAHG